MKRNYKDRKYWVGLWLCGHDELYTIPYERTGHFKLPLKIKKEIAACYWKLILSGKELTSALAKKLALKKYLQHKVRLQEPYNENFFTSFISLIDNDENFTNALTQNLEKHKNMNKKECFWPSQVFLSRLMHQFNIKYKTTNTSYYSRQELLCQCVSSLEMTYVTRIIFGIPGGKGQIINMDESMCYRYSTASKSWTI